MSTWYAAARRSALQRAQAEAIAILVEVQRELASSQEERAAVLVALEESMGREFAASKGVPYLGTNPPCDDKFRVSSFHDTLVCEKCGARIVAGEVFCPNGCHKV